MPIFHIRPIIIRSDRIPALETYESFNAMRLKMMDWWPAYDPGNYLLISDPLRLKVEAPTGGWSDKITGTLWYQVHSLVGYELKSTDCDGLLVLLEDVLATDTHGSGLRYESDSIGDEFGLAVVDAAVCKSLQGVPSLGIDGMPTNLACGVIMHEIGHAFGHGHTNTPRDDVMWEYWKWPNVLLEPKI